jgi:hypothetical protein
MNNPPTHAAGPVIAAGPGRYADLRRALGHVRRLYCDNDSKQRVVAALDQLIACARNYFPEGDDRHGLLAYTLLLREYVDRFDKFGLLSELHFLDRWLQDLSSGAKPPIPYKSRQRRLAPLAAA